MDPAAARAVGGAGAREREEVFVVVRHGVGGVTKSRRPRLCILRHRVDGVRHRATEIRWAVGWVGSRLLLALLLALRRCRKCRQSRRNRRAPSPLLISRRPLNNRVRRAIRPRVRRPGQRSGRHRHHPMHINHVLRNRRVQARILIRDIRRLRPHPRRLRRRDRLKRQPARGVVLVVRRHE